MTLTITMQIQPTGPHFTLLLLKAYHSLLTTLSQVLLSLLSRISPFAVLSLQFVFLLGSSSITLLTLHLLSNGLTTLLQTVDRSLPTTTQIFLPLAVPLLWVILTRHPSLLHLAAPIQTTISFLQPLS